MTNKKQIKANRENAKKGGVKTQKGKDIVRFNALKHGILSQAVYIEKGDGREDINELNTVAQNLIQELRPVGVVEEMLVDRVLSSYWRLRRVIRAEKGEIRRGQDSLLIEKMMSRADDDRLKQKIGLTSYSESIKSTFGIQYLLKLLKNAKNEVENEGYLTDETIDTLMNRFEEGESPFGILAAITNTMLKGEEVDGEPPPVTQKRAKKTFYRIVKDEKERLKTMLAFTEGRDSLEDESHLLAISVPSKNVLEKLTRYETALERSMYRALHELQRIQAARMGEKPPIPIAVDVDISKV